MIRSKNRLKQLCLIFSLIFLGIFLSIALESPLSDKLPFFNHYHFPVRALCALIPIFILATAGVFKKLAPFSKKINLNISQKTMLYFAGCIFIMIEFYNSTGYYVDAKLGLSFPYSSIKPSVNKVIPPVASITHNNDLDALFQGESSLSCSEPVFGYKNEVLKTQLSLNSTSLIVEDHYNITHPGCLLHASYFACAAWDRVKKSDSVNFQKFIHNVRPDWGVPPVIDWLIKFNFSFIVFLIILFIWSARSLVEKAKGALRKFTIPSS